MENLSARPNVARALHDAARRYCLERHALWCERYAEIASRGADRASDGYHYTPEALATFPRYNVLNAIRVELERIDPSTLANVDEAKQLVILAGRNGEDVFTRQPTGAIEQRAIAEEREAFYGYITSLSVSDLIAVEPLPFRRVLGEEEAHELWGQLRSRWQINEGYWYPLAECSVSGLVAFQSPAFEEAVSREHLRRVLAAREISRVWELREDGPEYEENLSLFDPYYNGAEGYWSSGDLGWIVYASHESSITVGGWLCDDLKLIWPSWQDHLWTTPFF